MDLYLILFTIAFFITMLVTPFIARLAFFVGAVDRPNGRKIHDTFMPRLGGLAIFLGFFTAMLVLVTKKPIFTGLLVGGTIVLILGMIDDIRGVSPRVKLLWQTMAALVVVYFCFDMDTLSNFLHGLFRLGILAVPLTVFWIVAVTNAVNLIDGLDGLLQAFPPLRCLPLPSSLTAVVKRARRLFPSSWWGLSWALFAIISSRPRFFLVIPAPYFRLHGCGAFRLRYCSGYHPLCFYHTDHCFRCTHC